MNLVAPDNDIARGTVFDKSLIDDTDEVIYLAYATLDTLDKRINHTQPGWWIQGPRINLYALFIFREIQNRKARQPFCDEIGFCAFWGFPWAVHKTVLQRSSSVDWDYILSCSLSGLATHMGEFSIQKLLSIVLLSVSQDTDLQRKTTVREWLFRTEGYGLPFYASMSHSAALLSKMWHVNNHHDFYHAVDFILRHIDPTHDHLLRLAAFWQDFMDPLVSTSHSSAVMNSMLRDDCIAYEFSWLAFFEEICETARESEELGMGPELMACARHFRERLAQGGAVSWKPVSLYVAGHLDSKVYRLDDEQSSRLTGLNCLHLFDAAEPEPGSGGWFAPPIPQESWRNEYDFTQWDSDRIGVIFETIARVKSSLREEQVVGFFGSEDFVFGDESTYFDWNADHSHKGRIQGNETGGVITQLS